MTIDTKTVDEIAHLARLEFEADAKTEIVKDMNNMLSFVNKLSELNTDHIQPLIYMTDEVDFLREDEAVVSITQKDALKNAPKKDSDYFKVAKVIEQK